MTIVSGPHIGSDKIRVESICHTTDKAIGGNWYAVKNFPEIPKIPNGKELTILYTVSSGKIEFVISESAK